MNLKNTRAIIRLSWPILIAQIAVLINGVADTVMAGHYSAAHLAGVGIAAGIYATVFFSLQGILQGLTPLIARNFGAGDYQAIGDLVRQGFWIALLLSVIGVIVLSFPMWILELAQVPQSVQPISAAYLHVIAWGLPGAMLARIFYSLTSAIHKPRPVMVINLCTLLIKIPLSYFLMNGKFGLPEMGGVGCAVGSVVMFWSMTLFALLFLSFDSYYRQFTIWHGKWKLSFPVLKNILYLGLPIALSQVIEITSFTFMALFLASLGPIVSAAHQIIANLTVLLFMIPLSLGLGTQILVSQALGAGDTNKARENAFAGIRIGIVVAVITITCFIALNQKLLKFYTSDQKVIAIAGNLLMLLAVYHLFDVFQTITINILRGYRRVVVPTAIYAASLWGIGLAFGWHLTFKGLTIAIMNIHIEPQGAAGMWQAGTLSLLIAAVFLFIYFLRVSTSKVNVIRDGRLME